MSAEFFTSGQRPVTVSIVPGKWGACLRIPEFLASILVLAFAAGCGTTDTDEHLEHVIPAHKPASFADGVRALETRGRHYYESRMSDAEHVELRDIVNWLPELSADSDLTHREWLSVQVIGDELKTMVNESPRPDLAERWARHMVQLHDLVPSADRLASADEGSTAAPASRTPLIPTGQDHD